ncbi:hypothetical protein QFZ76_003522 [Streptomyces sp. V4I2]|nr:hypothetical protein [Streptomyces sp. V4I2]
MYQLECINIQDPLYISGHTLTVPETFDAKALAAAAVLARDGDRLLANALSRVSDGGRVAQDLAGAPELLNRYERATSAVRALLEVAMDARRLGVGSQHGSPARSPPARRAPPPRSARRPACPGAGTTGPSGAGTCPRPARSAAPGTASRSGPLLRRASTAAQPAPGHRAGDPARPAKPPAARPHREPGVPDPAPTRLGHERLAPADQPLRPPVVHGFERDLEHRRDLLASPARHQRGHRPQPKGLLRRRRQLPRIPYQFTHAGINDPERLPFRINSSGKAAARGVCEWLATEFGTLAGRRESEVALGPSCRCCSSAERWRRSGVAAGDQAAARPLDHGAASVTGPGAVGTARTGNGPYRERPVPGTGQSCTSARAAFGEFTRAGGAGLVRRHGHRTFRERRGRAAWPRSTGSGRAARCRRAAESGADRRSAGVCPWRRS